MGLIYGAYGGRSDGFQPGSLGVGIIDFIRNSFFFWLSQVVLVTRRDFALMVVCYQFYSMD